MRRYIDASSPIIEYIDNLFLSRNISLDWWTDLNWTEDQVCSLFTSCCWYHRFILFIVIYSALLGGGWLLPFLPLLHARSRACVVQLRDNSSTAIDILADCPYRNWWIMQSTIQISKSSFANPADLGFGYYLIILRIPNAAGDLRSEM